MSFARNEFIISLLPLQEPPSQIANKTLENLAEIANILALELHISDPVELQTYVKLFFSTTDGSDSSLKSVINGSHGEPFTVKLLEVLHENPDLLQSHDLKNTDEQSNYFKSIQTLLELKISGIKIDSQYVSDFLAISRLLQNKVAFQKHMNQFEKMLEKHAEGMGMTPSKNGIFKLPPMVQEIHQKQPTKKIRVRSKQLKILSSFFNSWAQKNGFNEKNTVRVNEFLEPPDVFLNLLKEKNIFKDVGAGAVHGYWAHAFQVFMVVEELKINPSFLQHTPDELYAYLGDKSCKGKEKLFNWKGPLIDVVLNAWDILVDRVDGMDYRSPETLTAALLADAEKEKDEMKWPLLSACVKRILEKEDLEAQLKKQNELLVEKKRKIVEYKSQAK